MTRLIMRRAGVAASALFLAVAATLGVVAPAQAAPDTLTITSPTAGSTTETRTVTVAGAGTVGASVALGDPDDPAAFYGLVTVAPDATWTVDIVFDDDEPTAQSVIAVQLDPSDSANPAAGDETITFNLPDPITAGPSGPIEVTSPADNSTVDSRIVQFTGTVPVGSTLVLSLDGVAQLLAPEVDDLGNFVAIGNVPFTGPATVTFTFSGTDRDGATLDEVDVTVTVPAAIAAPVIETPLEGSSIATTQLTIAGTGVAGRSLVVLALSDTTSLEELQMSSEMSAANPIIVGADGRWTTTIPVTPGNYIAVALHVTTPTATAPASPASLPSNAPTFTITAPVVVAQLAATGTEPLAVAGVGAGFLLAGLMLVGVRRSRTSLPSIR